MSGTLGYMDLISMAEANSQNKQRELQRRQNSLDKGKKMDPKQVKLKVGVQKFLAKKEEEERRKKEEANQKKQQLMELRNQDRKATNRVKRMINMTKSANKSVIADARECLSEACNEQASETQPDEDDYGYTSTYANEMYNKMLEKYQADAKKEPAKWSKGTGPKIHHITSHQKPSSDKDLVQSNSHHQSNLENISNGNKDEKLKPKKKPPPPPPPAFEELMRLAEQKSKEPIAIKKPVKETGPDGPEFEFGRPMTAREKKAFLQEQALKQRAEAAFSGNQAAKAGSNINTTAPSKTGDSLKPKSTPIPKITPQASKVPDPIVPKSSIKIPSIVETHGSKREINNNNNHGYHSPSHSGAGRQIKEKYTSLEHKQQPPPPPPKGNLPEFKKSTSASIPSSAAISQENRSNFPKASKSSNRDITPASMQARGGVPPPNNKQRYPPEDEEPRKSQKKTAPSASLPDRRTDFLPPPSRSRPHPMERDRPDPRLRPEMSPHFRKGSKPPPPPHKGRPIIESDEEEEEDYDSEMDDFIDDSDIPGDDISTMIGQMFGYNKRKYVNEESDDECMESSVEQQMREEARTLRIGIQEDLEELKKEEEEERRKAALLKKRKLK